MSDASSRDQPLLPRQLSRSSGAEEDWRNPIDRDYDIILYSSAWRRLRGVTQVAPITDGVSRTHDRMLHSLKVAQVGKRLAEFLLEKNRGDDSLRLVCPLAVEVAGMAHDLGHPPFGHIAEKELQAALEAESRWSLPDSFEGNAQTFRILTRLGRKSPAPNGKRSGLDLSFATLAACTKYPWGHLGAEAVLSSPSLAGSWWKEEEREYYDKKWGFYDSDASAWDKVCDAAIPSDTPYSINAKIMDLADDITYAIHDVHDYFRMGLIPLHEIGRGFVHSQTSPEFTMFDAYATSSLSMKAEVHYSPGEMAKAKTWLANMPFPPTAFNDSDPDRQILHRFESTAVQSVQHEVDIIEGMLRIPTYIQLSLEYLKELTWFYVINHPKLSASQQGQRKIIRELHTWLCEWAEECYSRNAAKTDRNLRRLPARYLSIIENAGGKAEKKDELLSRSAVDFIVGLTDAEATSLHRHLGGSVSVIAPVSWL